MRQGITTKYLGPTNSRGSRIKATARKGNPSAGWAEMSHTEQGSLATSTDGRHTAAARNLAVKLGWSGLWIAGGKPEENGNMYVNIGDADCGYAAQCFGKEDEDWFYVPGQER